MPTPINNRPIRYERRSRLFAHDARRVQTHFTSHAGDLFVGPDNREYTNRATSFCSPKVFQTHRPLVSAGLSGLDVGYTNSAHRILITHIIKQPGNTTGRFAGINYTIRDPHLRPGKFATVRMVKTQCALGQSTEFVLRNNLDDPREHETHPTELQGFSPAIYGAVDGWVVNEKLEGLELYEVLNQIAAVPHFAEQYAQTSFDLMERAAQKRYLLGDVIFSVGHNVMVDPNTAAIRLVEHALFFKTDDNSPNAIVTIELMQELGELSIWNEGRMQQYGAQQLKYLMALLHLAFTRRDPKSYFYQSADGRTVSFSKDFIAAVMNEDEWEFWLLAEGELHKTKMTDKSQ